jgi:hypothetical protein
MKTILTVAAFVAALLTLSVETQAAQRSCSQICANAAQASPQELCVSRCQAMRNRNARKARAYR